MNVFLLTDAIIDKLLRLFVVTRDFHGVTDQNYDTTLLKKRKPGLIQRLFKRRKIEMA